MTHLRAVAIAAALVLAAVAPDSPRAQTFVRAITGSGAETIGFAQGVAVDPANGNVVVADTGNARVLVFTATGAHVRTISGSGMLQPTGVAVDPSTGNIAVSDSGASLVLVFTSTGAFVTSMPAAQAYAVAIDAANGGNIVVTEVFNNVARVYTPAGVLVRTIQGSGPNALDSPRAVAVDPANSNVLIADYLNGRIQIFASDGTFLRSLHPPTGGALGDDPIAPFGVAVDPVNGNIVVSSESSPRAIYVYNAAGAFVARIVPPTGQGGLDTALSGPSHVAIDPVNGRNIVLADRVLNRMQVYTNTFGTARAISASIDTLDTRATVLLSIACLLLGAIALRRRG